MRRKKKKSCLVQLAVLATIGYVFYTWLFGNGRPNYAPSLNQLESAAPEQKNVSNPLPAYGLRPTENTWPPVNQQGSTVYTDAEKMLSVNYYVMLDASGSMGDVKCSGNTSKMKVAAGALVKFAGSVPADANFGLAIFNGAGIRELIPLGGSRRDIVQIVSQILPESSTPLAAAVAFSYKKIVTQAQRQLGYGDYYLVLITDGIADKDQKPGTIVREILGRSPVQIYTIGFCISDRQLQTPLDSTQSLRISNRLFRRPSS